MSKTDEKYDKALELLGATCERMRGELAKVIIGQRGVIDQIIAAIFSRGHCLMVGVPGLAKTLIVTSVGRVFDLEFRRIQFTPDLMPSDITGTMVLDESTATSQREFRFVRGPLFANVILADEINRTPPKTQSALLEAMQERQVTVGQETYPLPDPFFVIATQNPIEQEGTYPLPEAQLDRFMFDIHVDYPNEAEEEQILSRTTAGKAEEPEPVLRAQDVIKIQQLVWKVYVPEFVVKYVARLVRSSRPDDENAPDFVRELVQWGAGPRAGQFLILGAKAIAAMEGRFNISTDDIERVVLPVLRHRIATNFQAQAEGVDSVELVKRLVHAVPKPSVKKYTK